MVKWVNNAKENELSQVFEFENSYVVANLTNIYEEGYQSIDDLENQLKSKIRQDKKANMIIERLSQFTSLKDMSLDFNIDMVSSTSSKIFNARKLISSKFPIGVDTIYKLPLNIN